MAKAIFLLAMLVCFCKIYSQSAANDTAFENYMKDHPVPVDSNYWKGSSVKDTMLIKAISRYNVFVFEHKMNAYRWQLISAKIIFFVVVLIVLTGLLLSYMQFKKSMRVYNIVSGNTVADPKKQNEPQKESNNSELQTSLELSKEGVKISSAVIGLIILIVSVGFFYLYLQHVFGINS
jgi:hypothetical protein